MMKKLSAMIKTVSYSGYAKSNQFSCQNDRFVSNGPINLPSNCSHTQMDLSRINRMISLGKLAYLGTKKSLHRSMGNICVLHCFSVFLEQSKNGWDSFKQAHCPLPLRSVRLLVTCCERKCSLFIHSTCWKVLQQLAQQSIEIAAFEDLLVLKNHQPRSGIGLRQHKFGTFLQPFTGSTLLD